MAQHMHVQTEEKPRRVSAWDVLGLVLCVVFALLLVCNLTIIVKGALAPDSPPAVLGVTPLAVLKVDTLQEMPNFKHKKIEE